MTEALSKPALPDTVPPEDIHIKADDGLFHLGAESWNFCQDTVSHPDKRLAQAEVVTLGIGKGLLNEAHEELTQRPQELLSHVGGCYLAGAGAAILLEALPPVALVTLTAFTGYAIWSYFNDKENQKRFSNVSRATARVWSSTDGKVFNESVDTISSALGKDSFQISTGLICGWTGAELCPISVSRIPIAKLFQPLSAMTSESIQNGIRGLGQWMPSFLGSGTMKLLSKTASTTAKEPNKFDIPFNYKRATTDTQKLLEAQDYFILGDKSVRNLLEYVVLSDYKNLAARYIPTIENFLKDPACDELVSQLPKGCSFLGAGAKRIGLLMPNKQVAIIGPIEKVPTCALAIQPLIPSRIIGKYQLDVVPYAESRNITQKDLSQLCRQLRDIGWRAIDPTKINIGKLQDGTLVVSDRDAITPRPRFKSMNPAKMISTLKGYLQSFSKLDLAEQAAVTADQIAELYGQSGDVQNVLKYKLIGLLKHSNNRSLDEPFMAKQFESVTDSCRDHQLYEKAIGFLIDRLGYPASISEEKASLIWLSSLFEQSSRLAELTLTKHRLQKLELEHPQAKP